MTRASGWLTVNVVKLASVDEEARVPDERRLLRRVYESLHACRLWRAPNIYIAAVLAHDYDASKNRAIARVYSITNLFGARAARRRQLTGTRLD